MAIITTRTINSSPSFDGWSLMKAPVTADETVLLSTVHGGNWRQHSAPSGDAGGGLTYELTDVSRWDKIAVMFMGQDANNETGTFDLYAYHENGPTFLVADGEALTLGAQKSLDTADANMPGFLSHSLMSKPVLDAFADAIWFVADTIGQVADTYGMMSVISTTDLHTLLILDLTVLQPKFLAFNVQIGTAAALGAIYYPLKYRSGGRAITGIGG